MSGGGEGVGRGLVKGVCVNICTEWEEWSGEDHSTSNTSVSMQLLAP